MAEGTLKGKNITRIWTIGSWYANGYIRIYYTERVKTVNGWKNVTYEGRLHMNTLLPILQKYDFEMVSSRTFEHLESPKKHREKKEVRNGC